MLYQLTEHVYHSPCVEHNDRPNLGYVGGAAGAVMVDAGNSPAHAAEFLRDVEARGLPRPRFVFLTHHHWDHTFGLAGVQDMVSVAGAGTDARLREMAGYTWDPDHLAAYIADNRFPLFSRPHLLLEYPDLSDIVVRTPSLAFREELVLELGDERCVMRHLPSPHTDECYYLLAEKAGVLFLGDANCEEVVGEDWIDHADPLRREIEALERLPFSLCVPGHMPPLSKEELLDGFRQRLARL